MSEVKLDSNVIESCIKGDGKSQNLLYTHTSKKMFAVCVRYVKDHEIAKDILQESYIKVFKNIHKYNNSGTIDAWIRRIMVNMCLDYLKKNKNTNVSIDTEFRNFPQDQEDEQELMLDYYNMDTIVLAIGELDVPFRTVFNLFHIENYSHEEIANELKIDVTTSRTRLRRAKLKLQEILKSKYESFLISMNEEKQ